MNSSKQYYYIVILSGLMGEQNAVEKMHYLYSRGEGSHCVWGKQSRGKEHSKEGNKGQHVVAYENETRGTSLMEQNGSKN